jgi:hypothetical protein
VTSAMYVETSAGERVEFRPDGTVVLVITPD